jgi:hypothetical protein
VVWFGTVKASAVETATNQTNQTDYAMNAKSIASLKASIATLTEFASTPDVAVRIEALEALLAEQQAKAIAKAPKRNPNGFVIYRGPSVLDGKPIVCVAIVNSTNSKTDNMVQTYIMRDDIKPTDALKTGDDSSVCGDCKHRPFNGGACYVTVFQGPLVVWKQVQAERYAYALSEQTIANLGAGRMVRLGSYGDPMAVPADVWEALTSKAIGNTGYTHQWRNTDVKHDQWSRVLRLCMASADSEQELSDARDLGLRTFRVRSSDEVVQAKELVCPASHEAGMVKTCATCKACDGTDEKGAAKASVVIVVHGYAKSRFAKQRASILSA